MNNQTQNSLHKQKFIDLINNLSDQIHKMPVASKDIAGQIAFLIGVRNEMVQIYMKTFKGAKS